MTTTQTEVLSFYARHSPITDPGGYARLYDDLPGDVPGLVATVQNVLLHFMWAEKYGVTLTRERRAEMSLRTVPEMLEGVLRLHDAPLGAPRAREQGLVSLCRDFAVLLVSMLRHRSIPARLRVGFEGYWPSHLHWDHRIAEYWNAGQGRWVLVDPQVDDVQRATMTIPDPLDVPTGVGAFLFAGDVWLRCRRGELDPQKFGDSETDLGLPPIRYALLHDFDALNQMELLGFDAWHPLIDKPEEEVTEADRELLNQIARLTLNPDGRFEEMRALYAATSYGKAVRVRLAAALAPPA